YREHDAVDGSVVKYPYDPTRAAQLIEGLGYRKGTDGTYRDAAAAGLGLELRNNGEPITEKAIIPIANAWSVLGIAAEPNVVPLQRISDRQYMAEFPGVRLMRQPDDPDAFSRFASDQTPTADNKFVGRNYSRYTNPDFEALINRYYTTWPWDDRMAVLGDLVHHMSSEAVILGMFYDADITFMSQRLVNVGSRESTVWNVHLWDLKP